MKKHIELLSKIKRKVNEQANDFGLWFIPVYATEQLLQDALRELHDVINERN